MASVGLVVEGPYDVAALSEFVRRCAPSELSLICRPCRSAYQLMKQFPGFLEDFRRVNQGSPVDKAIVIRDADRQNPDDLIAKMEAKITGRIYPFPRRFLVIVQELEAWLLADEAALSAVTGKRQRRIRDPEALNDPKERLVRILSRARLSYTSEIARRIASASRVDLLAARCPSFEKFHQAIID